MIGDTIIRGAAHYNALQAEAWRELALVLANALTDATDALAASQPFSDTAKDRHALAQVNANTALAKARKAGL